MYFVTRYIKIEKGLNQIHVNHTKYILDTNTCMYFKWFACILDIRYMGEWWARFSLYSNTCESTWIQRVLNKSHLILISCIPYTFIFMCLLFYTSNPLHRNPHHSRHWSHMNTQFVCLTSSLIPSLKKYKENF